MKIFKKTNLLILFALSFALLFGSFGIQKNAKNTVSANLSHLGANITLSANDTVRGGVDAELYIMDETIPSSAKIVFEYRTLEADEELYAKFNKVFKSKWSQSKIGKIVYFKVSCPTDEAVESKLQSARNVKVKVFMPSFLLNKSNYFIAYGYSPDSYTNILKDRVQIEDKNFVVVDMTLAKDGCFIALVYDTSWVIIVICVSVFLVILGFCVYLKIRKMHNEDPEYYAELKREKAQKKAMKQKFNNEMNAYSNKNIQQNASNKKNKPTPKQVKRKY